MQYFKHITLLVILGVSTFVFAQEKQSAEERNFLRNVNKSSVELIKQAKENGLLDDITGPDAVELAKKYQKEAKEIAGKTIEIAELALEQKLTREVEGKPFFGEGREKDRIMFVSFSMSRGEMRQALKEAARVDARVVINGLLKGSTHIVDTMKKLRGLSADEFPVIQINPKEFEQWAVVKVPVIAVYDGEKRYRATGTLSFDWLEREAGFLEESVKLMAFGNQGKTYPIVEEDLITTMQNKLAEYDWEGQKKKTWDEYWERSYNADLDLPSAEKNEVWYIDPTIRIKEDITNIQGKTLAKGGQVMNPLAKMGVPFKLYIFNPDDKYQVVWIKEQMNNTDIRGDVMVVATHIDQEGGWDAYTELKKDLNWHVYTLQKEMVEKFLLSGVPAIVEPFNGLVKVEQFNVHENKEEK